LAPGILPLFSELFGSRRIQFLARPTPENTIMPKRTPFTSVALLTAFLLNPAEAADPDKLAQKLTKLGYTAGASVNDIQHYKLDGWNYIDDQHVMIHTGPSERYMISLMMRCQDLSTAEDIGFSTTASQLTKFDKLVVRGAGGMKQDCPITDIQKLDKIKKEKDKP
jgi:hypothetical protein